MAQNRAGNHYGVVFLGRVVPPTYPSNIQVVTHLRSQRVSDARAEAFMAKTEAESRGAALAFFKTSQSLRFG